MFKAQLWMQHKKMETADRLSDAVVLEVDEPNDPVLINEQLGWDDKWAVVRVIPGYTEKTDFIEKGYWSMPYDVNHHWLAIDADLEVKSVEEMAELLFPPPQFTGTWLWGEDSRCKVARLLVFRSQYIVNVESTKLHSFGGKTYFMPGRSECSDVPE